MLTKNGKKCIRNIIRQIGYKTFGSYTSRITEESTITVKKSDGTDIPITNMVMSYSFPQIESLSILGPTRYIGAGIDFGSSSTPPSENDYTITDISSSQNRIISCTRAKVYNNNDGTLCCELTYQYFNDSSQEIILNEFGLFSSVTSNSSGGYVLVYRDVFDEPITVPPHTSKFINVLIKVDWEEEG